VSLSKRWGAHVTTLVASPRLPACLPGASRCVGRKRGDLLRRARASRAPSRWKRAASASWGRLRPSSVSPRPTSSSWNSPIRTAMRRPSLGARDPGGPGAGRRVARSALV